MKAFNNENAFKVNIMRRLQEHRKDPCSAVGCIMHDKVAGRAFYESELCIPENVSSLAFGIFYSMPQIYRASWPEAFLEPIPAGADLSNVWFKFTLALLTDKTNGAVSRANGYPDGLAAIERVAALFRRQIEGGNPTVDEWSAAASEATSFRSLEPTTDASYCADRAVRAAAEAAWSMDAYDAQKDKLLPWSRVSDCCAYASESKADWEMKRNSASMNHYRWQLITLLGLLSEAPVQ